MKEDKLIHDLADYALNYKVSSKIAIDTARWSLFDSMGCAILAMKFPACVRRLGPYVEGMKVDNGCRVPGTRFELDPVQGAFNIGTQIRWLDFNDTWLAKEWGHPSDNLGSLLALGDYLSRNGKDITIRTILELMVKAYEIQGCLALDNSLNKIGLDHVFFVKLASTATSCALLNLSKGQTFNALTNAIADLGPLRTYRHAPNTGPRKSWAAGDQCSRAVFHALMSQRGEPGYPSILSTPKWGFNDVLFPLTLNHSLTTYVMENILFKISFPAEFHAQTAVEAALKLHPLVKNRLQDIEKIEIETHESAMRIIVKEGPLNNPADRDHCLQYMVAAPLIYGTLTADHYEVETARNPLIDQLRSKMTVKENPSFTHDYLDPDKRSIANSLQIHFNDGTHTPKILQEYPLGHKRRREESYPHLLQKFTDNINSFPELHHTAPDLISLFKGTSVDNLTVSEFMAHFVPRTY